MSKLTEGITPPDLLTCEAIAAGLEIDVLDIVFRWNAIVGRWEACEDTGSGIVAFASRCGAVQWNEE